MKRTIVAAGLGSIMVVLSGCALANHRSVITNEIFYPEVPRYLVFHKATERQGVIIESKDFNEIAALQMEFQLTKDPQSSTSVWLYGFNADMTVELMSGIKVILPDDMGDICIGAKPGFVVIDNVYDIRAGQQVDSAEASTTAVPPSNAPGSPR